MTKNSHIQLRVTLGEKAAIQAAADRAGMPMSAWILATLVPKTQLEFAAKVTALAQIKDDGDRSYALADLHDFLAELSAPELGQAVAALPEQDLDAFCANYVAAMVELRCVQIGCHVPAWLKRVAPLAQPYFATELQSLRLYLLHSSPPPFRRRNLFIDTSIGGRV